MSLIATLLEGIGSLRFIDGRTPTEVQVPPEAPPKVPPKVPPMSPADELELLEKRALERGISGSELTKIRTIGNCPAQVQARIKHLHEWLAAH
jgi:hypothetical protein